MNAIERRLKRLEARYRPIDSTQSMQRAWLNTLDDRDLETLEIAVGHIESGGSIDVLPAETRGRYVELVEAFAAFRGQLS